MPWIQPPKGLTVAQISPTLDKDISNIHVPSFPTTPFSHLKVVPEAISRVSPHLPWSFLQGSTILTWYLRLLSRVSLPSLQGWKMLQAFALIIGSSLVWIFSNIPHEMLPTG